VPTHYLPNAWDSLGRTYYVAQNHPRAADENPGTRARPFKTIGRAAAVADRYDTVLIDAGTYREEVLLAHQGHVYVPRSLILYRALPGKKVWLKGSDLFTPTWEAVSPGVYRARLPEPLFKGGAYNPYALSCVLDEPRQVRPTAGPDLPETLGQIYVDGEALEQVTSLRAVESTPGAFAVSADGREIVCHFADEQVPADRLVELTVRERCFAHHLPTEFGLMIQTLGIVAEHAANPDVFSLCRPLTVRHNPGTGITVRKTFHAFDRTDECQAMRSNVCYLSARKPTLFNFVIDGAVRCPPEKAPVIFRVSEDGGKRWRKRRPGAFIPAQYFLDPENGILLRYYQKLLREVDLDGEYGANEYETVTQISRDEGRTWSAPERLHFGTRFYCYNILKLKDGRLFWMSTENLAPVGAYFAVVHTWLGTWRADLSGLDWEPAGTLEGDPAKAAQGLDEPHACQFPDGRIFAIFRQLPVSPTQDQPGFTSVKMISVSADCGKTWAPARPLTYEDGRYVLSSTSFPDTICSSRNHRAYVIININERPSHDCDPRTVLQIAELDMETLCIKRQTVAVIEQKLPEHHFLVRFSNWHLLEDRTTGNLLLFMKLQLQEQCLVRNGYDFNSYCYEIALPSGRERVRVRQGQEPTTL
jgi:hypothetical protein